MVVLKERFFAVPNGGIYPEWFEAGEEVTGEVADMAEAAGVTAARRAPKNKAMKAPERK